MKARYGSEFSGCTCGSPEPHAELMVLGHYLNSLPRLPEITPMPSESAQRDTDVRLADHIRRYGKAPHHCPGPGRECNCS